MKRGKKRSRATFSWKDHFKIIWPVVLCLVSLACFTAAIVSSRAAESPVNYIQTTYEPTVFSGTDISEGEAFSALVKSKGVALRAPDSPVSATRFTYRYFAINAVTSEELILNREASVTVEPFPMKAGDSYQTSNEVSLRFPPGSPGGDYTVVEEVIKIEIKDPKLGWQDAPKPTKPSEPAKPVAPIKPTEPNKPSEPTKPPEPVKPSEPSAPTRAQTGGGGGGGGGGGQGGGGGAEPTKPSEPSKPSEPTKPPEPAKPSEPSKPSEPAKPVGLVEPSEPPSPRREIGAVTYTLSSEPLIKKQATLTKLALSSASITGGDKLSGTVTLSSPAPAPGFVIGLLIDRNDLATVPENVTVPAGENSSSFEISTKAVATQTDLIVSASLGDVTVNDFLTINPVPVLALTSFEIDSETVQSGATVSATLTLNNAVPAGGQTITFSAIPSGYLTFPTSLTLKAGETSTIVKITAKSVGSAVGVTLKATLKNKSSVISKKITVTPLPSVSGANIAPAAVIGGTPAVGKITLKSPALADQTVTLTSTPKGLLSHPATVTVKAGEVSATFDVLTSAPTATSVASLKAALNKSYRTATLTVKPLLLAALSVTPHAIESGFGAVGTVTLTGPAPVGGKTVWLKKSASAPFSLPSGVVVEAGATSANFDIRTLIVTARKYASVTATLGSSSKTYALTITPQIAVTALSIAPSFVMNGAPAEGIVILSAPAPESGKEVLLSADSVEALTFPPSVTIKAGETTGRFEIASSSSLSARVTITAKLNNSRQTATLEINPERSIQSLSISPSAVYGGDQAVGTVTLNGPAPEGGLLVTLQGGQKGTLNIPTDVMIKARETTATFGLSTNINTLPTPNTLTVSAELFSSRQVAKVTVTPTPSRCVYACRAAGCGADEVAVPLQNSSIYACSTYTERYSCGWTRTCYRTVVPTCCRPK
ncbi:MAG: hypothetical protein V1821_00365 [bacterium]